jgi:tRNA threonylcarbamoyladenosine biosynthesis protein TsaE
MTIRYSEADLPKVAQTLARQINAGDVVAFYGELAAGKTTLIREIARELGFSGIVNSPTYVIEHRYQLKNNVEIVHLDLYRLDRQDLEHLDCHELSGEDKITFVEWPEQAEAYIPKKTKKITIEKTAENSRSLKLSRNFND